MVVRFCQTAVDSAAEATESEQILFPAHALNLTRATTTIMGPMHWFTGLVSEADGSSASPVWAGRPVVEGWCQLHAAFTVSFNF